MKIKILSYTNTQQNAQTDYKILVAIITGEQVGECLRDKLNVGCPSNLISSKCLEIKNWSHDWVYVTFFSVFFFHSKASKQHCLLILSETAHVLLVSYSH